MNPPQKVICPPPPGEVLRLHAQKTEHIKKRGNVPGLGGQSGPDGFPWTEQEGDTDSASMSNITFNFHRKTIRHSKCDRHASVRLCSRDTEMTRATWFCESSDHVWSRAPNRPADASPAPYLDSKRWNYGVFTCASAARGAAGRLLPACPSRECQSGRFMLSPTRPPLPTNGRHRRHSGPKINREPCEQNEARRGAA